MGEKHPPYMLAWSGSYPDVQGLPKAMRRVLQQALTTDRDDPAKFLVAMGRLLRFCDIGTVPRRRARQASASIIAERVGIGGCIDLSQSISRVFSQAFRAVRYRERHVWEEDSSPGLAIVLVRDDLESLMQAVRRGAIVPPQVKDAALDHALRNLRNELDDHIQTVDALHDDALDGLIARDLAKGRLRQDHDFLDCLVLAEPVRWWLSVYRLGLDREAHLR